MGQGGRLRFESRSWAFPGECDVDWHSYTRNLTPASCGGHSPGVTVAFEDAGLAVRIRARDPDALEAVVKEYLPQVVRAARGAGLHVQEAEDVAHATFVTFLEKADTFEGRSQVRTWLFGILFRKIMEMRRIIERERQTDDIDEIVEKRFDRRGSWSTPPAAEAAVYSREVLEHTSECLDAAPPRQRAAFLMREVEGLATAEICKILEISDTNLGVMLFRVRNRLRECLEGKGVWGR
jgi:RNA polymerase sigma-70 factor, ECF subfamily